MILPEDFRDLLVERHDAEAEFVVLGGHAVAFHGHPRATKDREQDLADVKALEAITGRRSS